MWKKSRGLNTFRIRFFHPIISIYVFMLCVCIMCVCMYACLHCSFVGYCAGACSHSEDVVTALIVLFAPVPITLLLVGLVFFHLYPINKDRLLQLQRELGREWVIHTPSNRLPWCSYYDNSFLSKSNILHYNFPDTFLSLLMFVCAWWWIWIRVALGH